MTQAAYGKVIGHNPSWFSPRGGGGGRLETSDTGEFPVESVSWEDADQFCKRLSALPAEQRARRSYRLPTEAEWEYACRAGSQAPFSHGSTLDADQARFNAGGRVLACTGKVRSYRANPRGLFDMHGNVAEWCADWYDPKYYARPVSEWRDPKGPEKGLRKVVRGGSWQDAGKYLRSAARAFKTPTYKSPTIGFRVVMEN